MMEAFMAANFAAVSSLAGEIFETTDFGPVVSSVVIFRAITAVIIQAITDMGLATRPYTAPSLATDATASYAMSCQAGSVVIDALRL